MSDQVTQEIKDKLNIVDVIGVYIQLKKAGVNFRGLCPFHSERTPSFNVSPQRQIWHCFGCGEGGDIFAFIMRQENVDFKEALKILAQKAGVELPQYRPKDPQEQEEKDLALRIVDFASRFYHQSLLSPGGQKAGVYLSERGLSPQTIKNWRIGFAPDNFQYLKSALIRKNISENQMIKAGVCLRGEKGNVYDRFRGRITFPIFNYFGEAVGFSARILPDFDDGKMGKYINSPESAVYSKSRELFGLYFAKEAIRKKDEAVVVEGQMDCIAAHQAGFKNTVASSGTALTNEQLDMLGRLTKNLIFCFDSDEAGLKASRRAGEAALQKGFRLKVISLKNAKDPDELIRKSPGLWEKAVGEAMWFLDYYMQKAKDAHPQDPLEQKHYLSAEVVPFLKFISDPLEQDHYVSELVKKFGISEKVIRGQAGGVRQASKQPAAVLPRPEAVLEKEMLGGLFVDSLFASTVRGEISPEDFENPEAQEAISRMLKQEEKNLPINNESPLVKESVFMVESLLEQLGQEALHKRLLKSYSRLKIESIKKKQKSLQTKIAAAEAVGDKALLKNLQRDFAGISKEKVRFENK